MGMKSYNELVDKINEITDYDTLCRSDIIENVYSLKNDNDKAVLISKMRMVAKNFKELGNFDKLLLSYEKKLKFNKMNNVCIIDTLGIPSEFNYYLSEIQTGEFVVTKDGIFTYYGDLISPTPIIPYYLYQKNVDNVEKVRILFYKNDKWRILDIDRLTISNQGKIIDLSNHGIGVNSANSMNMVKYLNTVFDRNTDDIIVRNSVSKLGWVDDLSHFIPYHSDNYDFVLSVNDKSLDGTKQTYDAICEKGDYDVWFDCMQKMRTNIPTRLAFGASAISPLLTIIGAPCFVTMLYGQTGTGKTLSCRCAMSMWGDPNILSMRADSTTTSIVRKCLFFNNLPLFVDEFQLIKKEEYIQEFLMSVTEGIQRTRATADSSNNFTSSAVWKNCTLITGERQSTTDTIGGGAINRIIELRIDDNVADEMELQDIYYKIDNNYGFLGKKLIDLYMNKDFQEKIKKRFVEIQDSWRKKLHTASKQLIAISCLVLGDEILREYVFKDKNEIKVSDVEMFVASKEEISYSERAYKEVCDLIVANFNKFVLEDAPITNNGKNNNSEIWGAICKNDSDTFYINNHILRTELKKSGIVLDKTILEDWRVKGYIECTYNNDGSFDRYTTRKRACGKLHW